MSTTPEVHLPPISSLEFEPVGGRIGPEHSDFIVAERPLYEASGEGPHLYWFVEKRGMTTPEMLRNLARYLDCDPRDIGYAGMKDKHAVTRQWISVPESVLAGRTGTTDANPDRIELPEPMRLLEVSRHTNKLRLGHSSGNRFEIRLVDLEVPDPERAVARALQILNALNQNGLPNYFGRQRFGHGGSNLQKALDSLAPALRGAAPERGQADREPAQPRHRPRRRSSFEQKLFPSVLQSEVFNRYVSLRVELGLERLLDGEVVRLGGKNAMFTVTDPAAEQARLASGDIVLTGPMPGKKMKTASAAALQLETAAVDQLGLSWEFFAGLGRHGPGTRRDVVVRPGQIEVRAAPGGIVVGFDLPSGSYATQVIRELTREPFFAMAG